MPLVFTLIFLLLVQTTTQAATDEIDAWVKGFNPENLNGLTTGFDLPENTPPEKVVEALAQMQKRDDQFRGYKIIETKKIMKPDSPLYGYTVVLIASDKGSKTMIVLDCPTSRSGRKLVVVDGSDPKSVWYARPFYITTVP